jgi:hypothetical protein
MSLFSCGLGLRWPGEEEESDHRKVEAGYLQMRRDDKMEVLKPTI